jgi:hypothetical protein
MASKFVELSIFLDIVILYGCLIIVLFVRRTYLLSMHQTPRNTTSFGSEAEPNSGTNIYKYGRHRQQSIHFGISRLKVTVHLPLSAVA